MAGDSADAQKRKGKKKDKTVDMAKAEFRWRMQRKEKKEKKRLLREQEAAAEVAKEAAKGMGDDGARPKKKKKKPKHPEQPETKTGDGTENVRPETAQAKPEPLQVEKPVETPETPEGDEEPAKLPRRLRPNPNHKSRAEWKAERRAERKAQKYDPNKPVPWKAGLTREEAKERAADTAEFFQNFQAFFENHQFETDEDRVECLESAHSNLLSLLDGDADLLNHKVVGAGAEFLIKVSTVGQIRRLFQRIGGNFSRLMCGGGSSRVVELLLSIVFSAGTDLLEAEEAGEGGIPSLAQLVCRLVDEVASDVPDVFVHTFGSFSLRMLVRVLGGLPAKEKEAAAAAEDRPVFIGELNRICAQVAAAVSADVVGTCQETATNGCLQVVVEVLATLHRRAAEYHSDPAFDELLVTYRGLRDSVLAHFATLAAHQTSARVVEALLKNAAAEEYVEVYERHIAPQFMDLACSWGLGATFVVQAVIQNAQAPEHLEAVLGHLTHEALAKLLRNAKFGILNHLLQAAKRLGAHQQLLCDRVSLALRSYLRVGDGALVPTALAHRPFQVGRSHFGHIILQQLFAQGLPYAAEVFRDFAASVDKPTLVALVATPSGSRLVEAYVENAAVGQATALAAQLEGHVVELAKDVNASYVIQKAFNRAPVDIKANIATELAARYDALLRIPQAMMVLKRCNVDLFRHREAEWRQQQQQGSKRDQLMERMLGGLANVGGAGKRKGPAAWGAPDAKRSRH